MYFGLGDAAFGAATDLPDDGFGSTGVVAEDMDRDGDIDLVFARRDGAASVVMANDGNGTFSISALPQSEGDHRKVATGDFDGDGLLDIVLVSTNGTHSFFRQGDDGSFSLASHFGQTGEGVQAIAAGDLDGDGDVDLVAGTEGANLVYRNSGDGHFEREILPGDPGDTYGIALGDMNGDAILDIVIANSGASNEVLLGIPPVTD